MEINSNNAASKQTQWANGLLPEGADEAYRCVEVCVGYTESLLECVWVEDVLLIAL